MQATADLLLFFGRFHPLLVHLPIGMLAALAAMEMAAWIPRFKNVNASAGFVLSLAAPLAILTALCGWLLSLGGDYQETLLAWHKWLGTVTAAGIIVAAILFRRGKIRAYRATLLVTTAILMATGHLGGSLTHGSDYLTHYAPGPLKSLLGVAADKPSEPISFGKDPQHLPVFAGLIAPVFESKCVNCHGPAKSKAKLRLDSFEAVMKGGQDGAVVVAGNAAASLIMQRVSLPADSDDHMPPRGKPQLTDHETALLKWWVEAGAPENKTVAELHPPPEILGIPNAGRPTF